MMNGNGEAGPDGDGPPPQPVPVVPVIKQEPGIKTFGRHGDIKRLMKVLSKRNEYIDLNLVCQDGKLGCHKFIIGSQSRYLKLLIQSANPEGDDCTIVFPDVKMQHMEVVLKFLYTGKLGITRADSNIIKELLEKVLHIDAKVTLPENIAPTPPKPASPPGGGGGGGGTGGSPPAGGKRDHPPPSDGGGPSNGHDGPLEKRPRSDGPSSSSSLGPSNSKGLEEKDCSKSELRARLGLPASLAPPTPPHELEYDDLGEVEVLPSPDKPAPGLVSLDEEDPSSQQQQQQDALSLRLFQAPRIISKRTGGAAPSDSSDSPATAGQPSIASAPRVVCKSTGYHPAPRRGFKSTGHHSSPRVVRPFTGPKPSTSASAEKVVTDVSDTVISERGRLNIKPPAPNERLIVKKRQEPTTDVFLPSTPDGGDPPPIPGEDDVPAHQQPAGQDPIDLPGSPVRATRTSTGSLERVYLNEEAMANPEEAEVQPLAQMQMENEDSVNDDSVSTDADYHPEESPQPGPSSGFRLPLPPGLGPGPEGYVIHRGKWVPEHSILKHKKKSYHGGSIKRYNYSPGLTITGNMFQSTLNTLSEPDGRWPCDECSNVYTKQASLKKHKGRMHHPDLKVQCPECPKRLSHRTALAKHLLSHRPEEQWPFRCRFCGKHFQAKADIPKHWATARHRDDPQVPKDASNPNWKAELDASEIFKLRLVFERHGGNLPRAGVDMPQVTVENGDMDGAESTAGESVAGSDFNFDEDDDLVFEAAQNLDALDDGAHVLRPPPPEDVLEAPATPAPTLDADGAPPERRNSDGAMLQVEERPVRDTPTPFNISDILDG